MNLTLEKTADTLRVVGALDIYEAPALRKAIIECLVDGAHWTVDLSQVTACDAAGAQILWSAHTSALKLGKRLYFEHPAATVLDCWAGLGMPTTFFEHGDAAVSQ